MDVIFEPGRSPGIFRSDRSARGPHEIAKTHRPGIRRIAGTVDHRAGAGHNHRSGRPDDGRRIRLRPSDEERRRTGGGRYQRRRRRARQEAGARCRGRCLRPEAGALGRRENRQRENSVRRRSLLLVVVDPGLGSLCRRQRPADHAGLHQPAIHRARPVERGAGLRPRRPAGHGRRRLHRQGFQGQEHRHPQRQDHLRQRPRRRDQEGAQQGRRDREAVRVLQQGRQGF